MNSFLIVTIVPHNEGERITGILKHAGAGGSTVLMGRGTAENPILQMLGVGECSKDIIFTLITGEQKARMIEIVQEQTASMRSHYGILFSLDISGFFKSGHPQIYTTREEQIMAEKTHKLISVILNKGYADDAMAAARKAGAGGGTIIHARGTAREEDVSFLGIPLVPEKEMLLILVEQNKSDAVFNAICSLPCLAELGSGIAYSMDVDNFTGLGKNTSDR